MRSLRVAFAIRSRDERGDELVGEVPPIGVIEVERAGAAHHCARRKTNEVLIPPNAKLLLMTNSVWIARDSSTM